MNWACSCANKRPKRRVRAKLRDDRRPATQPNETWSMDFVHDRLATGKKTRVLTVATRSRGSRRSSIPGSATVLDVVAMLEQGCAVVGYPKMIRVDQGSEFIPRLGPLGLGQWRHAGLLPTGEADGRCLH